MCLVCHPGQRCVVAGIYARRIKRGAFVALSIFKVSVSRSDIELCATGINTPRAVTLSAAEQLTTLS